MVLEMAYLAWYTLVGLVVVASITVLGLVVSGKLKPPERPPRRWQVAFGMLAVLLLAGLFLP